MTVDRRLLLVSLLQVTVGCASFTGSALGPVPEVPVVPEASRQSIAVALTGSVRMNGIPRDANAQFVKVWTDAALKEYERSALFSKVSPGLDARDLRAEIVLEDDGDVNLPLSFLTGLTFYAIPSRAVDRITLRTVFKNARGDILGSYEKHESVTLWTHVFLIPLMPFKFPGIVGRNVLRDLNRATLAEAAQAGILTPERKPSAQSRMGQ